MAAIVIFPGDDYQDQHSSRASSLVTSLCIRSITVLSLDYFIFTTIDLFDNYVTYLILAWEPYSHASRRTVIGSQFMRARLPGQNKICDVIIERVYFDSTFLTVFILTHPVNFSCGRKSETRRKPTSFGRALTDSFHMSP